MISAKTGVARVVLFVDGTVGQKVAEAALQINRESVAGFVVLPGRLPHVCRETPYVEFFAEDTRGTADKIRALAGDTFILGWWPLILTPELLDLGQTATLNLHPSLLPYGRGKDPNFWTLRDQDPFGVTIHHVDTGIDTGDIAFQRSIPYRWVDTGQSLYERACSEITSLFRDVYPRIIAADVPRIKQDIYIGSYHSRKELAPASKIEVDGRYTARELLNLLRARTFPPHPACYFTDEGTVFEVRISITEKQ